MSASFSVVNIVLYLAVFAVVGVVFLFVNLVVGWFLRPNDPHKEKLEIYECGEPTIGSGFVQFDLRFYVVALLFIIFDVEVAFFFPWALVFGKANHLASDKTAIVQYDGNRPVMVTPAGSPGGEARPVLSETAKGLYRELGIRNPSVVLEVPPSLADQNITGDAAAKATKIARSGSKQLALITLADIAFFFAVLMIGFAYVWKRGDLDWVRHVSTDRRLKDTSARAGDPLEEELAAT
jgi:NADH-quinone oxidoreductase subunit A